MVKYRVIIASVALLLAACSNNDMPAGHDMSSMNHETMKHEANNTSTTNGSTAVTPTETLTGNEFTITAKEAMLKLNDKEVPVWTFNGSVPGSQIRVKQGEDVKITLKNELSDPVTIHWHGVPVPNKMDGIPGVTMNAVKPGETFTYEFKADTPGTYWYHSHQDSVNQVDKGLYGSFIVEAKDEKKPDRDYTLVLDEWISEQESTMSNVNHGSMQQASEPTTDHGNMQHGSNADKDHGKMTGSGNDAHGTSMEGHDMSMYDIYTINGKTGSSVEPLNVKEGERVRIRLINAGFISHNLHLHGHSFKITATDGQSINNPNVIRDQVISVAPGERYDIEFTADNPGEWYLEDHGNQTGVKGMKALIQYEGSDKKSDQSNESVTLPVVDLSNYGGSKAGSLSLDQKYNLEYNMNLGTEMGDNGMVYTINGKTFPDTDPIQVKTGDLVKVTFKNTSEKDDHPMHLHGHFFQILSKNGSPVKGAPIVKDTLNVKPGEEYVVAFKADNPGNWMFHCHDLHHASTGMVSELTYKDYKTEFTPDPNAGNKPE